VVVPVDGQGVPLVPPPPERSSVRLVKGQKRTTQKEAVVPALYPLSPYQRTPQDVVAAWLQDASRPEPVARPPPVGNELRATLAGQGKAMSLLAQRVAQRDGPPLQPRVALTDGAEALPQPLVMHVPEHPLGLAILHATESLGDTATARLGETHPQRLAWVRAYLEPRLAGQTGAVITALAAEVKDPTHTVTPPQVVRRTVGSDRRHHPSRHDDAYLACGWPMGTGVGRRRVWAPRERSPGAIGDALDPRWCPGRARPAGGAAQWSLGYILAVSSAPPPSAALWPVHLSAGVGRSPRAEFGCLMNRRPRILVTLK